jgi:hypothetical protein
MILSNVFLSHIKKDIKKELKEPTTKQFTKIKILDFYTKNEIIMSKIIEKLNDYHQYFHIILKYSMINLSEVDNTLSLIKRENPEKTIFLHYSLYNIDSFTSFTQFFLEKRKNQRNLILNIIYSFKCLLKSIQILSNNNIVHFLLTPENILFNEFELPFITNFSHSFDFKKLNEERISYLFSEINTKSSFFPLQAHICTFLLNHSNLLSKNNIEQICDKFFKQNNAEFLGVDLKKCKENNFFSLQHYINKPKEEVINDIIINFSSIWDVYSLCIIYLNLLNSLDISCQFIEYFQDFLREIIPELFLKRENKRIHSDLLEKFEKMVSICDFEDLL